MDSSGLKEHTRGPIRSEAAAHVPSSRPMIAAHVLTSPIVWTCTIKTWSRRSSECMKVSPGGKVHQSMKEGGARRRDGWKDSDWKWRGMKRKERRKS